MKLEEVLASKLKCLIQRKHSVDFYDYCYSLFFNNEFEINKSEVASIFLRKTIFQKSPGAARRLLIGLPFQSIKKLCNQFIICPIKGRINLDDAIANFGDNIRSMFQESWQGTERYFFPPEIRNPILEAGSNKKKVEFHYGGIKRLVEPYSLKYKIKKNGVGQEYFYGWDRVGGASSGPGIKTFTNDKIDSIEISSETFEPRFEIEVAKAGEIPSSLFFTNRSRPKHSSKPVTSIIYIYECSVCGKQSRRKRKSNNMRKHKDEYGNYCYGRRAIFIDVEDNDTW